MYSTSNKLGIRVKDNRKVILSHTAPSSSKPIGVRQVEQASLGGLLGGSQNSLSVFAGIGGSTAQSRDTYLKGIISDYDETSLRQFYRDIYYYDAVAGSAVDLMSTLPFSDFDIVGLGEKEIAHFENSIENLNLRTLFPEISVEYLVMGLFTGTLMYRGTDKIFTDIIPHNAEFVRVDTVPMYGMDPLITVTNSESTKRFMASNDPYMASLRNKITDPLLRALKSDSFTLDPLTTLYLPRRTFADSKGVSFYRRLLPIYFLEKVLFRGTLVEAGKRQRAIMHVTAGDEQWEPTPTELNAIVGLFQQADLDPLGSIVATRQSITPNDIRPGGDFWKWTDIVDSLTPVKLRALGVSESFLSGDETFATAETNLTVFIESIRSYRDMITRKVFYNKLFPVIAAAHGLYKDGRAHSDKVNLQTLISGANDLLMPTIRWHKSLHPRNDRDTLETLETLEQKGVPVSLRMWAAAGSLDLDSVTQGLEEDLKQRTLYAKFTAAVQDAGQQQSTGQEGPQQASLRETLSSFKSSPSSWVNRDFGEAAEIVGKTKTGKPKHIPNQRVANDKANRTIVQAMDNLSDENHYNTVKMRIRKMNGYGNL